MNKKQLEAMVLAIVRRADSDIGDALDSKYAEEPEYADECLAECVAVAKEHLEKAAKKLAKAMKQATKKEKRP